MIAEALAVACGDRVVLSRLGGGLGEAAVAALARLEATPPEARRGLRATWAAIARAPVPPGFRGVHGSWIEAALAELPARARTDLAHGGVSPSGATHDPVAVWLVRWACAHLPPLPPADAAPGPPASLDAAIRLSGAALTRWLSEIGADQLALAVGAAGREALATAVRTLGAPVARAAARIAIAPRAGALGPVRAAIERCRVTLDDHALPLIGARALAPHVALSLSRRQLSVRLPRPLGLAISEALEAHTATPIAQAPTWAALGAAY